MANVDGAVSARYAAKIMTLALALQIGQRKSAPPAAWKIAAMRLVLIWERAYRAFLPALGVAAAFAILSLTGVWTIAPAWLHLMALAIGAAILLAALWRAATRFKPPSRRAALARLEENGALAHAPLQALEDTPFNSAQTENPLWRAHHAASLRRARGARFAAPRDLPPAADPYGLRYMTAGLFAIAMVAAGADWRTHLAAGLAPFNSSAAGLVADLWIEPPEYAGRPPVFLLRAGEQKTGTAEQINVPEGARLVGQIHRGRRARLTYATEAQTIRTQFKDEGGAARAELLLKDNGLLQLSANGQKMRWPIGVIADHAPSVSFSAPPEATEEALVAFAFTISDDYNVSTARLEMRLAPDQARPLDAPALDPDALAARRVVALDGVSGKSGAFSFALDLQSDPWAGLDVLAAIIVEDGAGQIGRSDEAPLTLPMRTFYDPLAKSVLEQRQTLAVAASQWRRSGRSFDAITMAPDVFFDNTSDYLLLRAAFWRVMRQDGAGFDDAVEKFWPLALQLEDKTLELARQRLEAAREALREALERGAGDDEINRLVEELRQAMNDYLAAMAQSGQTAGDAPAGAEQLGQSDLDDMLDAIRDLAQSGAGNAARQMLSDLENLLDNLRVTRGGSGRGQEGEGAGDGGAPGRAGELIGRQRELADESFERSQSGGEGGDELAEEERALADDLDDLIDDLQNGGGDENGDAARTLGEARNDMRDAEQALRNGDFDGANSAMDRAIANLREGAEQLAREEMQQGRQGQNGADGDAVDPLGRPAGSRGDGVAVPEETDAGRARAVIQELRRRLGEPGRSEEEIEYLERLLEQF